MPIDDQIQILGLKAGQPITEDWMDHLVEVLTELADDGAVTYDGEVKKDLVPYADGVVNLGSQSNEFLNLFTKHMTAEDLDIENITAGDVYAQNVYSSYAKVSQNLDAENVDAGVVNVKNFLASPSADIDNLMVEQTLAASNAQIAKATVAEELDVGIEGLAPAELHVYGSTYSEYIYVSEKVTAVFADVDSLLADMIGVGELSAITTHTQNLYSNPGYADLDVVHASKIVTQEFGSLDALIDELTVNDTLNSPKGYIYSTYSEYVKSTYAYVSELDVELLHVLDEIDVPDYSIGFIKLDPRLLSSGLRDLTVPASGAILVPRGVFYANLPSGVVIQANFNGEWVTVLTTPGLVISDGVNVRASNSNTTEQTVPLLQVT